MDLVIQNGSSYKDIAIKDRIPEYSVALNAQENWDVEVYDSRDQETKRLTFRYPPTPDDIYEALI